MARRPVPTALIVVDAITRERIARIPGITVPTAGSWWVRSDVPGVAEFIRDAQFYAEVSGVAVDIVSPVDVTRSFEVGHAGQFTRAIEHR